ncbi:MAG: helix-turn-helix transcriptional regulator [Kouleothrix sp.]|jgi:transcriptional regulator with XRE-family HTH domain|nr:helix-turn-helix transcriptional regulator [Kouleothrix sp.]
MPKSVFSPTYEQFRARLIQARTDAGLTQMEVATLLKRPQSFVSKYENGERRLDVIEFLEIAQVLQIDVAAVVHDLQQYLPKRT